MTGQGIRLRIPTLLELQLVGFLVAHPQVRESREIAERLGMTRWSVDTLASRLRQAGLVERSGVQSGQAPQPITVTPKGRAIYRGIKLFSLDKPGYTREQQVARESPRKQSGITPQQLQTLQILVTNELPLSSGDLCRTIGNNARFCLNQLERLRLVRSERSREKFGDNYPRWLATPRGHALARFALRYELVPPVWERNRGSEEVQFLKRGAVGMAPSVGAVENLEALGKKPPAHRTPQPSAPLADETLVGLHEIADAIGVTKQVVYSWRVRFPSFPKPLADLRMGPVWKWGALKGWVSQHSPAE
jgi:hypothetical protein